MTLPPKEHALILLSWPHRHGWLLRHQDAVCVQSSREPIQVNLDLWIHESKMAAMISGQFSN